MAPKAGAEVLCTRSPQSCHVGSAEDAPRVRPHELAPITGLTVVPLACFLQAGRECSSAFRNTFYRSRDVSRMLVWHA